MGDQQLPTTPSGEPLIPFGPGATCTLELCPIEWTVLKYRPSLAANVTFMTLFFLIGLVHTYLGIRWRSWWFMICMIVGSSCTILGYAGRVMMWINPFGFYGFMIQIVCVGSAPVFYCAAIYVTISKLVTNLDISLSRIPPLWYYVGFLVCDVVALSLQAVGGALSTLSNGSSQTGIDLALAGLSFQVVTLFAFSVLLADYLIRYFRKHRGSNSTRLVIFIVFQYLAIILIFARSAYRVDELRLGYTSSSDGGSSTLNNEPLFIGMEGVLIAASGIALFIGHPGFVFSRGENGIKGGAGYTGIHHSHQGSVEMTAGWQKNDSGYGYEAGMMSESRNEHSNTVNASPRTW